MNQIIYCANLVYIDEDEKCLKRWATDESVKEKWLFEKRFMKFMLLAWLICGFQCELNYLCKDKRLCKDSVLHCWNSCSVTECVQTQHTSDTTTEKPWLSFPFSCGWKQQQYILPITQQILLVCMMQKTWCIKFITAN